MKKNENESPTQICTVNDTDYLCSYDMLSTLGIEKSLWDKILETVPLNYGLFNCLGRPELISAAGVASLVLTNTTVINNSDQQVKRQLVDWCADQLDWVKIMKIALEKTETDNKNYLRIEEIGGAKDADKNKPISVLKYVFNDNDYLCSSDLLEHLEIKVDTWESVLETVSMDHVIVDQGGYPEWIDAIGIASLLLTNITIIDNANIRIKRDLLNWCKSKIGVSALVECAKG